MFFILNRSRKHYSGVNIIHIHVFPCDFSKIGWQDKPSISFSVALEMNNLIHTFSHGDWLLTDQWDHGGSWLTNETMAALLTVDINQGSRWSSLIDRITQQPWGVSSSFCSSELPVSVKIFSSRSFLLTVCLPLSHLPKTSVWIWEWLIGL